MKRKIMLLIIFGMFFVSLASVSAVGESACCERTQASYGVGQAWCQNAPIENCDSNYKSAPTSCESTSFCRLGVCIDSQEGICMPNSPESTCVEAGGIWDERGVDEIPQCQLGCCLVGDQAAFTTNTRCKQLSSIYGLESEYRDDIQSESACLSIPTSDVEGACVFNEEFQRTCEMITQKECNEKDAGESGTEFYPGYLCSNEELNTNCGPRGGTTCLEDQDEVYFLDTCGNVANIYDENRIDDGEYWSKIIPKSQSCNDGSGNKNSKSCGNCDYLAGSTCKEAKRGEVGYGENICRSLDCVYEDVNGEEQTALHGETWCAQSPGVSEIISGEEGEINLKGENTPGSRYYRRVCYNGEVTTEPCAEFRQEICVSSSIPTNEGEFRTAQCRANEWQFCSSYQTKTDCVNPDNGDCYWLKGERFDDEPRSDVEEQGTCLPKYSPGFQFWGEGVTEGQCSAASYECLVTYETGIAGGRRQITAGKECLDACREREECGFFSKVFDTACDDACEEECTPSCITEDKEINKEWFNNRKKMCSSLGDCGIKTNYLSKGVPYYDENDILKRISSEEAKSKNNAESAGPASASGGTTDTLPTISDGQNLPKI